MKLLENDYYSFKAHSDKFFGCIVLRCHLTEKQDYFNKAQLKSLLEITDDETARCEIDEDELNLSFNTGREFVICK